MPNVTDTNQITQEVNSGKTSNLTNNQQNQTQSTSKQIILGCDSNGVNDSQCLATVQQSLEQAGYQVEPLGIAPGPFAEYSYSSEAKGKIGVYLMAASLVSFLDAAKANFDYNVFGIRGDVTSWGTEEGFKTKGVPKDHHGDCIMPECDTYAGKTYPELNDIYKGKCVAVPGENCEQLAQNIVAALGGQTVSNKTSNVSTSGGAVSIPDKTFYGLIKQIIGAIDGVFIIANNMAYLLSFKDFYEYRDLYDKYIPIINKKDVLDNSLIRNWTTDGYYNSVEVTYSDGIIKYQNDALVQQYGENTFYYSFPNDDEETAKAKADALLGAHIRDYSTEIQLSIFYNENITAGSWVKLHKSLSQLSGKTHREMLQDSQKKSKKFFTKHNGIDITNLVEKTITQDKITKTIQTITDKEGNKFDIEIDKSEYELFFVQSYTCRWDKDNALIMDLILKYGPDTPEDPVNATIGIGNATTSNQTVAQGGQWGNDCFTIADLCIHNNDYLMEAYEGGNRVEELKSKVNGEFKITSENMQGRANQNSNYAKKYSNLSAPEVYSNFRSEYRYSLYCDNCTCWKCATDFYDNAGKTANCGDTTCLLKVFFDSAGVPCIGLHIYGHYFNAIQINGTWEIIDGVRLDNQTCNFPDGTGYCFGNPCPCDSYPSGGHCNTC